MSVRRFLYSCPAAIVALGVVMSGLLVAEDYQGKDLRMRDFSNKNLAGANFEDANLFLTRFANAVVAKANFQNADLTSSTFNGAEAAGADFRDATFKAVSMQSADLSGAIFAGTDLGNISFQSSKLRGANLRGCQGIGDVLKADLRESDLRGAVFTCTLYYMEGVKLKGAKYDKSTRWPKGFDVAASGAVMSEVAGEDQPETPSTIPTVPAPISAPRTAPSTSPPSESAPGVRLAPKLDGEKLTEEIIKHLLETEMWAGKDTRRFTFNYKSLKIAEPRQGTTLGDIASGKKRIVTPVRVQLEMIKAYDNNETRKTDIHQDYEFFRDEFGTWSYRFQGNR
ncbi:Serine/threonine-protein kinase B [Anatilimnocola aggregata]|uniref:Serine/threonine-protein kinase B n=1 Tax=Anatilimnocola aggregata TaxID=2528021 RepID=A0A517YNS5_9BACT|nr:pentapeptide repeat-containing protein [Anatilimnocola aggregata]QDU31871.1 Serine/threonine-protein kinase B [Anatilimnocola aggregata]